MATALINQLGCSHYKRKCKFVTPCCNKTYTCRVCHDEVENHSVNRRAIRDVVCMVCSKKQRIQTFCRFCKTRFGNYACMECNLFDDEDKGQFHCVGCAICRVGGAMNYFHCEKCNMCLNVRLLGAHTCVENRSHTDCPVCLDDIHSSRIALHVPECGHLLHQPCFEKLENSGHTVCPTCKAPFKK